ncbi:Germacrene A synthase [Beauveria bassiana]|nr:Germacrene A synthase [Beauveria bassiana]KAH8719744.1 (+)-corvol ether B synthase/(+)-corvol ether A synthase ((2E,6E)-farnesyl diphosphate cyclizing) [Beauveria bassiana]
MDIKNLEGQLAELVIPTFVFPWAEACSPHAETIEARMLEWADKQGLFINDEQRKRASRGQFGWLASRCYPNASLELLQVIADLLMWSFSADDVLVDRTDTLTVDTLRNLTAMMDVIDLDAVGEQPVYSELALFDACRRLRQLVTDETFYRFNQGGQSWLISLAMQILNHMQSKSVDVRQYETIRRYTNGLDALFALSDVANRGLVDSGDFCRPEVRMLCMHAKNIIGWSNDIHSLFVEARQPGQFWNMVFIHNIYQEGHSLQESVDYTATRVNAEISRFVRLSDTLLPDASPQLQGFIDGLKYWTRGNQDWVDKNSLRYAASFATMDADNRDLL